MAEHMRKIWISRDIDLIIYSDGLVEIHDKAGPHMEKVILDKEEVESIAYEFNLLVQRNNPEDYV